MPNLCLGDNQALPLTPEEEKEGKMPEKKIVYLNVIQDILG